MNKFDALSEGSEAVFHVDGDYGTYWAFVSKVGGGTAPRRYRGAWFVTLVDPDSETTLFSESINTFSLKDHYEVGGIAVALYEDRG